MLKHRFNGNHHLAYRDQRPEQQGSPSEVGTTDHLLEMATMLQPPAPNPSTWNMEGARAQRHSSIPNARQVWQTHEDTRRLNRQKLPPQPTQEGRDSAMGWQLPGGLQDHLCSAVHSQALSSTHRGGVWHWHRRAHADCRMTCSNPQWPAHCIDLRVPRRGHRRKSHSLLGEYSEMGQPFQLAPSAVWKHGSVCDPFANPALEPNITVGLTVCLFVLLFSEEVWLVTVVQNILKVQDSISKHSQAKLGYTQLISSTTALYLGLL